MKRVFLVFLIVSLSGLLSCSAKQAGTNYLRDELANKGTQTLNAENPYVASNLFLAREMELSPLVKGFIRYRGTPDAIEVKSGFWKPLKTYLYYMDKNEGYLLERTGEEWLIRGPETLPTQVLATLFNVQAVGRNAPLVINGKVLTNIRTGESGTDTFSVGTATDKTFEELENASREPLPRAVGTRANLKQEPSGDIIHKVTLQGETLRIIASWYTGNPDNAPKIARINGLDDPNVISFGQTIRIPRYLLTQTSPLPEVEIQRYEGSLQ